MKAKALLLAMAVLCMVASFGQTYRWDNNLILRYDAQRHGYHASSSSQSAFLSEWHFDWQNWVGPNGHMIITDNHGPLPYWDQSYSMVYYVETYNGMEFAHFLISNYNGYLTAAKCGIHYCNERPNVHYAVDYHSNDYSTRYGRMTTGEKIVTGAVAGAVVTAIVVDLIKDRKRSSYAPRRRR